MRFLEDVMEMWISAYFPGRDSEVGIASAFEECLRRRGDYMLVPQSKKSGQGASGGSVE
jgi:hypothetical protein